MGKTKMKILKKIGIMFFFFLIFPIVLISEENKDFVALLVGNSKGEVLKIENGLDIRPMASITKIMTSLLVLEDIKKNKIKMSDKVKISKKASKIPYGVKLIEGKRYTVEDLLKATIIKSSNNAAYSLAEYVSGDVDSFVKRMNKKAKELNLTSLQYCTPHGLPPKYTGTCMDMGNAFDIYKLALNVVKYKEYIEISTKSKDVIDGGKIVLYSTNNLLDKVEGIDGLKTGYHSAAGSSIVLSAIRNKDRVFVVILGSKKALNRDIIGTDEIEKYYNGGKTNKKIEIRRQNVKIVDKEQFIELLTIDNVQYGIYPSEDIYEVLEENEKVDMMFDISIAESISISNENNVIGIFVAINKFTNKGYIGTLVLKKISD